MTEKYTYTAAQVEQFNAITDKCGCECHTQPSIMHITSCCALTYFPRLYVGRTTTYPEEHIVKLLAYAQANTARRDGGKL